MADSRLFCDLTKLTAADRERLGEVTRRLAALRPAIVELAAGYALAFDGEPATYALIAEWLGYERLCCGFLEMQMTSIADAGAIVVSLTGAGDAKAFVRAEFEGLVGEDGCET
jgi:hypothetical protein